MTNYLVTGGAGFIGSALVKTLNKEKNSNVLNIDKLTYAGNPQNLKDIKFKNNYYFKKLDICNQTIMNTLFKEFNPDFVYHLAAETNVDKSIKCPTDFLNTNILGTASLLNAALLYWDKLKGNKKKNFKFISVSTDEVYGSLDSNDFFNEKSQYMPNSPYSASKASSDHLVRAWYKTYGLPTIITNCSNNYGPFQYPEKLIPLTIINAIRLKKIPIYGDGRQIRDWLHVKDHVDALLKIGETGNIGTSYVIGGDCQISNLDVIKRICAILDKLKPLKSSKNRFQDLVKFVKDRPGHDKRYAIDFSKLSSEIGWSPKISFDQGLLDTVNWYLYNQNWWKIFFHY